MLRQTTIETPATTQPTTATVPTVELAPKQEIQVPPDWIITSVVGTDPLVALAYRPSPDRDLGHQVLWRVGSDPSSASDVTELFPEHDFAGVQKLLQFDGRFFAFATGQWDETESGVATGPPQYLVSADGIEWSISAIDAGPLSTVVRAGLTPDAPPYSDTSAVMDATVHNDTMYATGWDLVDEQVAIIVWSTTDGERWVARRIPHRFFETEYGAEIVVGEAGMIVRLGGPVHTGVGALLSVVPDRFFSINDALNLDQSFIGGASQGGFGLAVIEYGFNFDDDETAMSVTTDGATWSRSTIPRVTGPEHTPNYRLAQSTATPIIYSESWEDDTITVLHQKTGGWTELGVLGQRVVNNNGRLLTWEPGLLRLYALP